MNFSVGYFSIIFYITLSIYNINRNGKLESPYGMPTSDFMNDYFGIHTVCFVIDCFNQL